MEVREFDWDSSRKGASQLSRTKTIRLSTPKTTTGEILILPLTSPLISSLFLSDSCPGSVLAQVTVATGGASNVFNFQFNAFEFLVGGASQPLVSEHLVKESVRTYVYCKDTKFRHFTIFDISAAIYFRRGIEGMV